MVATEWGYFKSKLLKKRLVLLENLSPVNSLSMMDLFHCLQLPLMSDPLLGFFNLAP
jgi:hypothetical protein